MNTRRSFFRETKWTISQRFSLSVALIGCALAGCSAKEVPLLPEEISGHCTYKNKFSGEPECRNYHGDWPSDKILEDCADWDGTADIGTPCSEQSILGQCILEKDGLYIAARAIGDNPDNCGSTRRGCELFGGGVFDAAPICGGTESSGGSGGLPVFQQPIKVCVDPKPGEAPGKSDGGKVCTWEMISGATEEGRHFEDYASCDRVRTQRPYYPAGTLPLNTREDPRLQDPAYATEHAWVKSQVRAAACVCCHSTKAPKGPSNWYVDQPGNFINGFFNRGLAMGAGWIDTAGFGAYPASENNGFTRTTPDNPGHGIFPTTDDARMRRFFENELAHRGKTRADFATEKYVGGPIDEQRFFRPAACTRGEGVRPDGLLVWKGGNARYVYVLEATAASPTVPPNLDLPQGTIWRIDVPVDGKPVASGTVQYGSVPAGLSQKFPANGSAPSALVRGKQYYLYALADILQPVTRCLFTAP